MNTPESLVPKEYQQDQGNLYRQIDGEIWSPLDQVDGRLVVTTMTLIDRREYHKDLIGRGVGLHARMYRNHNRTKGRRD